MPTFIHTGDLHLNALRRFSNYYLDRARDMLDGISFIAKERSADFILVAGDVYDRRDITHKERQLFSDWLSSVPVPVIAISGNHDKRSSEIGDTCLSYLASLSGKFNDHLIYDGPPTVINRFGCNLVLIPYQGWMDQELFIILDTIIPLLRNDRLPIVVALHEAVHGCTNDVGFSVTKDHQIRLDGSFQDVTYWALGDMHLCQEVRDKVWYSGAPHQTRFDETPGKGVLLVDTDTPSAPELIPVPSAPLVILEEVPDKWPGDRDALVQFRPVGVFPGSSLPPNVEFHPTAVTVVPTSEGERENLVGIFDGLDTALLRAGLPENMHPLAWRLAIKMAKKLGITEQLPERYRTEVEEVLDE